MIEINVQLELVNAIRNAVHAGERTIYLSLPHRLYITDRQSKLFEEATSLNPGYMSGIDNRISELLLANINDIIGGIVGRANYIDLGPGYPIKSLNLIDELIDRGVDLTYYAVDVSPYFLDRAVSAAHQRKLQAIGIRRRFEELEKILDKNLSPAVMRVIFLGLTFNNFPPPLIVSILSAITRPGDVCLICCQPCDEVSEADLLKPYLGEKVRAFAFEPLRIAGFSTNDVEYLPRIRNNIIETRFILKKECSWIDGINISPETEFITAQSYRLPAAEVWREIDQEMAITAEYIDQVSKIVLMKLTGRLGGRR
jgi:hypothetical protein